jgi:GDPmannose 4,6-dehydratase
LSILITGAAGQDGRLLARNLLIEGRSVTGLCKPGYKKILSEYCPGINIIEIDLTDERKLTEVLNHVQPDEIYNLAGFSSVYQSWKNPNLVTAINSLVPAVILKWCVEAKPSTRLLQASSSEIFGTSVKSPQSELTPHNPITPYGLSKSFAHTLLQQFRNEYGLHASIAILYNHESPLRDFHFVTRKITRGVAAIAQGSKEPIRLGQIHAQRDWGWAPDYVNGMQKIICQESPGDFILATGVAHSVADLLSFAFKFIGISEYSQYIEHDQRSDRHVDPANLVGDNSRASNLLDWAPTMNLEKVIAEMVDFDIKLISNPELKWFETFDQK